MDGIVINETTCLGNCGNFEKYQLHTDVLLVARLINTMVALTIYFGKLVPDCGK